MEDAPEEETGLANLPLSSDGKYLVLTATDDADLYPETYDAEAQMAQLGLNSDSQIPEEVDSESEA